MNIEIKDLITLSDNNKYVVCSKTNYQDNEYLYLIDFNNNENIKFGMIKTQDEKVSIVEIENPDLIKILLPLFLNGAKDILEALEEQ